MSLFSAFLVVNYVSCKTGSELYSVVNKDGPAKQEVRIDQSDSSPIMIIGCTSINYSPHTLVITRVTEPEQPWLPHFLSQFFF